MREFDVITAHGRIHKIKANYVTFHENGQIIFTNDNTRTPIKTITQSLVIAFNKDEWKCVIAK